MTDNTPTERIPTDVKGRSTLHARPTPAPAKPITAPAEPVGTTSEPAHGGPEKVTAEAPSSRDRRESVLDAASDILLAADKATTSARGTLERAAQLSSVLLGFTVSPAQIAMVRAAEQLAALTDSTNQADAWAALAAAAASGGEVASE